jgi:hypothetical protein
MSDELTDETERTLWWGKPIDSRRYHVFEGDRRLCRSLCSSWSLRYDGEDPEVDPENDTFSEGSDCKKCSRKAGVLNDGGTEQSSTDTEQRGDSA